VITFSATTTLSGLEIKVFSSAAGKLGFRTASAKSMTGVRYIDVNIVSMTQTSRRGLNSIDSRVDINSGDSLSERDGGRMKKFEHESGVPRRLATNCAITWNVSVELTRLGTTSGSTAYTSMTSQLYTAMTSGTFATLMKSPSTAFSNISSASVVTNAYTVMTVITPTAAPSSAPTVSAVVPIVSQMIVSNVTKTSLSLSITLIKTKIVTGDISGGFLYCVSKPEGIVPSSIGGMKSFKFSSSTTKGASIAFSIGSMFPLTLSLTFTGLSALQVTAMYCYVETSIGTGSSLAEVLQTKVVATTACCKILSYVNAPIFVFGDLRKYSSKSVTSTYVFTYSLSTAPSESVQVSPVLELNGVVVTTILAIPDVATFTKSSLLNGQFILSSSSTVSGSYNVSLTVTGTSAAQYTSGVSTLVQILSSSSPVPAPFMRSSRFSDSGQAVVVTFDSLTDQAGITTVSWPCSSLFIFTSASLTTCSWVNTSAVRVSFGVTSVESDIVYLSVGNSMVLIGGLLKAFCSGTATTCALNPFAASASVTTETALNPSGPTGEFYVSRLRLELKGVLVLGRRKCQVDPQIFTQCSIHIIGRVKVRVSGRVRV
jgi:hypothetical protein